MSKYLIFEPGLTGHHGVYLENIVSGLLAAEHHVSIVLEDNPSSHAFGENLKNLAVGSLICIYYFKGSRFFSLGGNPIFEFIREFSYYEYFRKSYNMIAVNNEIDIVLLPYIDYCLYALGCFGSPFGNTRFEGIAMRPSFHFKDVGVVAPFGRVGNIKRWLFERVLKIKTLSKMMVIDPTINVVFKSQEFPVVYFPDPSSFQEKVDIRSVKSDLGIDPVSLVVLVYGAIDARKGLDTLVNSISSSTSRKHFTILVVGEQSPDIKQYISETNNFENSDRWSIISIDRRVTEREEGLYFSISDVVWLGYKNHYTMSGVLIKAAQYVRPVVATRDGLIGWFVNEWRLGITFGDPNDLHIANYLIDAAEYIIQPETVRYFQGKHTWRYALEVILTNDFCETS